MTIQAIIDDCMPYIVAMAEGRYAISLGGSRGKRIDDSRSDIDFRLFCDGAVGGDACYQTPAWQQFEERVVYWRTQGINIDYCWIRTVADIDGQIDAWLRGDGRTTEMVWTLWGYHVLTDITNQYVIVDEHGLIAAWQARLTPYPAQLKQALITKHVESLVYWKSDYHYHNKVLRGDVVFLAGMGARLVHDMMQILFALNERYYVGDGNNLHYVEMFAITPPHMAQRVIEALQALHEPMRQYELFQELITDVLACVPAELLPTRRIW
ncbi:MAG: DUF4037 domain-containing protein [Chloroflexi bacterium]|nr:DUF4037 domain-containing protein [Chloroflexota bacterium]